MFGNGKEHSKPANRSTGAAPASGGVNTIDAHTTIKGDVEAGGDIRIDGKLIGNLSCRAKVIIGETGHVDGDIDCDQALVEGTYTGNIVVRELLTIKDTARLSGSIRASKMAVGSGSLIDGRCTITGSAEITSAPPKPLPKPEKETKSTNGVSVGA
ncbi:polymer-forming cytoskeletal protein [Lewinella sp. IMCC34183]|uniref:bactofilin family protein n=1 Tax=Lewinella sp. IMCC34183 TaxID=2248762 RepID=UPI000E222800|nr:polymer-forming cytoskeletal protein [Lewinella sp. IMCC34183]